MTEEELLLAVINDKARACNDNYMLSNTNFLDSRQQSSALLYLKQNYSNLRYEFFGGFDDAERKILVFLPDYINSFSEYFDNGDDDRIIVPLKIKKDNFSKLSHGDYLGAIMGLGIKREMLGDISVTDDGCTIVVMNTIKKYLIENLTSVGMGNVNITECDNFDNFVLNNHFEEKRCYVSSMRADAVIAEAFSMSRSKAVEKISRKEAFADGIEISKADSHISFGTKLVIRGKGKVIIYEDAGITKKGRQTFIIKKYC